MEENQIYTRATGFVQDSLAIQQIFRTLPEGTVMNVTVAERIEFQIRFTEGQVQATSGHAATADVLYEVDPEVFRRLGDRNPADLSDFFAEFGREILAGRIQMKLLKPVSHFLSSSYMASLKRLVPALQGEALQKLMMGAVHAQSFVGAIKDRFRR